MKINQIESEKGRREKICAEIIKNIDSQSYQKIIDFNNVELDIEGENIEVKESTKQKELVQSELETNKQDFYDLFGTETLILTSNIIILI